MSISVMIIKEKTHDLSKIIVGGSKEVFKHKGRYIVWIGSRGSGKSKTIALRIIVKMTRHPEANCVVFRRHFNTLRMSVFNELLWAIDRLDLSEDWSFTLNPLEITRKSTKQKIFFRGLDKAIKSTSMTVRKGVLCWAWIEEAYELEKEEDFDMINLSIRGNITEPLYPQIILTLNPWNEHIWIKKRFFDTPEFSSQENGTSYAKKSLDGEILALKTTYLDNQYLDKSFLNEMERMKKENPRYYKVAGLGEWGISEGLIYDKWIVTQFDIPSIQKKQNVRCICGLDFGYVADPSAFVVCLVNPISRECWIVDEFYEKGKLNVEIYEKIKAMGYEKERIIADSAEPKSIDDLRLKGLSRIVPSYKGNNIMYGVDMCRSYKVYIDKIRTPKFLMEISNYTLQKDNKTGELKNKPEDRMNHLMDAWRYAIIDVSRGERFPGDY